ncbi:MAG: DNA repair protein RecO [Chloroflexi bacterium]|jgi:DNA repair protein RecO (recombination protein O)|nr:DNA repair protein RecO [Chloroflexota bacterium]
MPQPRLYRVEAIVLRQQDYGEADRILTLLTAGGKVTALARGIRRSTSHNVGQLGLYARANLLLAHGRNMETVTQVENLDQHEGLHGDLLRFSYASYLAELCDRFAQPEEESQPLYDLLAAGLRWMATRDHLWLWARYFELQLLALAGYRPELFVCVRCGRDIEPVDNHFSASEGGVVCARCGSGEARAPGISLGAQKVLRYLTIQNEEAIERLRVRPATARELEGLLWRYLEYTLERELPTTVFLRRMRRELGLAGLDQPSENVGASQSGV